MFRGQRLYLGAYNRATLYFWWTADAARAIRFADVPAALPVAKFAADTYAAETYVHGADGSIIEPSARNVPATARLTIPAAVTPPSYSALSSERGAPCDAHTSYDPDCALCARGGH